jgi:hypothetical protein
MQLIFLVSMLSLLAASSHAFRLQAKPQVRLWTRTFMVSENGAPNDAEKRVRNDDPDSFSPGISNSMREKLLRENAAFGGNPNEKSSNPILIIGAVVAALALASSIGGYL